MSQRIAKLANHVLALLVASIALEIVAQLLPPHYSPIGDTESALAVGPYGWLEVASLCLRGALVFVLLHAASLAIPRDHDSRLGAMLLACVAAGKFVIAFVPTDPSARPETVHGAVHAVVAFLSFFAAAIGEVLIARRLLPLAWMPARLLLRIAWLTVVWTVVITATAGTEIAFWGVLERIETVLLLGWIALFAAALRHRALGMVWR